jgi:hypothetical protein
MSISVGLYGRLVVAVVVAAVAGLLVVGLWGPVSAAWATCPNEEFRIGPSADLPDCRAYELVSPPDKNGGEVDGGLFFGVMAAPEQAAAGGEAITYGSSSAFLESEATSALVTSQYVSRRTASGWQTRGITPTQQVPGGTVGAGADVPDWSLFQGFGEDLEHSFLLAWTPQPDPSAPAGFFNPYLRDNASGSYQLLSSVTPPVQSPLAHVELWCCGYGSVYAGMSADGQHVIFVANDALTPEAVPGRDNLYEWSAGRPLELVSVLPGGAVSTDGGGFPLNEGLQFGAGSMSYSGALSSDGMRAFWMAGGHVYMHEITGSGARSIEISASQKGAGGAGLGKYWTANSAGSLVYFTSGEQLTVDSTATTGRADLYQYNVETGALKDLTVDPNAGESAGVMGVVGSGESEGAQYVYFVAQGVLAPGASEQQCREETKEEEAIKDLKQENLGCNLYLLHDGVTTFIATLGFEDSDFTAGVLGRTARVSPDGLQLAFQSEKPLTGYKNIPASGPCPVAEHEEGEGNPYENREGRCMEVFEYGVRAGRLVCASCDPSGLPPTGNSGVPITPHLFNDSRGWESSTVQQRYLLDDGRLFFDSEDALLPQATNGKQNVYEYEPEGVGECAATGDGGCVYLLSTGTSSASSTFLDAGSSGRDVFFLTRQQLVAEDGDEAIDVYDAREDGGFSEAQAPPCGGEACRPAVTPAPAIYGAPPSATFLGAANPPAASSIPVKTKKVAAKKTKKTKKTKESKRRQKQKRKSKASNRHRAKKATRTLGRSRGARGRSAVQIAERAGNGGAR